MITAAALCPSPPLLHPALTGRDAVLPELRGACAEAVSWLLREDPGEIVVVGPATVTGEWDAAGRLDPASFAPAADRGASRGRPLPLSLGLGAMLLDQAGYEGGRRLLAVGQDEPAAACAELGALLGSASASSSSSASASSSAPASTSAPASVSGSTALLVMGDGSARRSLKAPGYLDPRAAAFDAEVERALRAGDLGALLRLDQALAHELMATGRPAWQVLAGAIRESALVADVLYCGDPFGVAYLVACLRPGAPAEGY